MGNSYKTIDIIQYSTSKPRPLMGRVNALYIDSETNISYRWDSSLMNYASIESSVSSINVKGSWNALTNTPILSSGSGNSGDLYIVSVGNNTISPAIDGIDSVAVGDWILSNETQWQHIPAVNGVNPPIQIDSNTTVSGLDTLYLVDTSSGDIEITVPLSNIDNQSRFMRFIKITGDTNSVIIKPTSPQTFGGDLEYSINILNEAITLNSTAISATGWIKIQDSRSDRPIKAIEFLAEGNTETEQNANWKMYTEGNNLIRARYENGLLVPKATDGDSITTDNYYADVETSTYNFRRELVDPKIDINMGKLATTQDYVELGDSRQKGTFIGGLKEISHAQPIVEDIDNPFDSLLNINKQIINDANDGVTQIQYTLDAPALVYGDALLVREVQFYPNEACNISLIVYDNSHGREIYRTVSDFELSTGGGFPITSAGLVEQPLLKLLYLLPAHNYTFTVKFQNITNVGGNINTGFNPYFKIGYLSVISYALKHKEKNMYITSDITIENANRTVFNDNIIISEESTNKNITIEPNVFSVGDELSFKHSNSSGSLTITQQGAGAEIEGESNLIINSNCYATIKYVALNKWIIIKQNFNDEIIDVQSEIDGSTTYTRRNGNEISIESVNNLKFQQNATPIEVNSNSSGSDIVGIYNYNFELGYTYEIKAVATMYDNKNDVETKTRIYIDGVLKEQKYFDIWLKNSEYEAMQNYYYTPTANHTDDIVFNCAKASSEKFWVKDATLIVKKLI